MNFNYTQNKTKNKLEKVYKELLDFGYFYSIREIRRKYKLEFREVVKYILPLVDIKKKTNIMGKDRFEMYLKKDIKENINCLKKIKVNNKAEEMFYKFILFRKW